MYSCAGVTPWGRYLNPPEKSSSDCSMESCVMSDPKLGFEMWGIRFNAEGALAIFGAVVLVLSVLAFYRF